VLFGSDQLTVLKFLNVSLLRVFELDLGKLLSNCLAKTTWVTLSTVLVELGLVLSNLPRDRVGYAINSRVRRIRTSFTSYYTTIHLDRDFGYEPIIFFLGLLFADL